MADLADIERMVDDWERNAAEKAQRYQRMREQIGQLSITESVANGAVTVTVGPNGIPTGITMTDAVRSMKPDEIASSVLRAMQKAQSRYPARIQEIVAETVGEDDTSRHIVEAAERSFPPPPEEDEEPARPVPGRELRIETEDDDQAPAPRRQPLRGPRQRRDDSDEEDFGDQSFLRRR